ncbi:hypothetical protein ABPG75_001769 [Micractinium tetrahymenae]
MPATPASRRKSGRALPELPPGLQNATLLVPRAVFPKERVPAGFKGWRAQVVGVDTKPYDDGIHCNVKFEDYPELYHFPVDEVQQWVVEEGDEDVGAGSGGKLAAVLREGLFTAMAVLIVYTLLSCFYQPLDTVA